MLPSGLVILVFDPPEPDGGPFLDLLHAVRRRRLGLHEALPDLLLVPVGPGGSAEPVGRTPRGRNRLRGVVPLIGPRRGFLVRRHVHRIWMPKERKKISKREKEREREGRG